MRSALVKAKHAQSDDRDITHYITLWAVKFSAVQCIAVQYVVLQCSAVEWSSIYISHYPLCYRNWRSCRHTVPIIYSVVQCN